MGRGGGVGEGGGETFSRGGKGFVLRAGARCARKNGNCFCGNQTAEESPWLNNCNI